MSEAENPYHDLVTEAINTKCFIYEVKRFDPDGRITSLAHTITEEEYDEVKSAKGEMYANVQTLNRLVGAFTDENWPYQTG